MKQSQLYEKCVYLSDVNGSLSVSPRTCDCLPRSPAGGKCRLRGIHREIVVNMDPVYTVHRVLYTVNCPLYVVQCTLYPVHCTRPGYVKAESVDLEGIPPGMEQCRGDLKYRPSI